MSLPTPDISKEISFRTSRSGGSGGQNVNKVESAVEGLWHPETSQVLSAGQKQRVLQKLANRINAEGQLSIRSQVHRTQKANKEEVIKRLDKLLRQALTVPRLRIATKPTESSKMQRLENKKRKSEQKQLRNKKNW